MSWQWTLPDGPAAAAAARREIRAVLPQRPGLDDVLLVVSELCANAVRHGQPPVVLRATVDGAVVRVEVENARAGEPDSMTSPRRMPEPGAEGGRGLAIVEELADDWGWKDDADTTCVWAELRD